MRFGAGQSRKPAWSLKTRLSSCCLTSAVVSSVRAPGLRSITRQVYTLLRQLSRISQKVRAAEAEQFNPSRVDMGRLLEGTTTYTSDRHAIRQPLRGRVRP